ncbi:N amino acid transport system protein [Lepidopterella palustris CBS 459.81]|uniref:N amino acid transport system protein n=1 Tax=Lepidopterella palustris CBS 459.81 TaxID=1314670 RepID=A0A8E2EGY2_9PEZI|nr:N amino acid transport system protein [Lepidopterella palustris CBS 459.81]
MATATKPVLIEKGSDDVVHAKFTDLERLPTDSDGQGQVQYTDEGQRIRTERYQVEDPVFGDEEGAVVHYRTCEWWHAGILMLAETISLGVLALPQAVATLGLFPGMFCIFFLGIAATYTGYIIGQFKQAFPQIQSFADAGELIAGPIGREVMAVSQVLILIFIMAAHVLSFSIAMNVLTNHSLCSVWFGFFGLIICFLLGLPRTLKMVSFLSIFSCISVIVAVTVAMVAIGITKPDMGNVVAIRPNVPLDKGLGPVMNIILAYAGHVAFFSFCAELKKPQDFPKALAFMQITACTFYLLISAVIYYYAGPKVASPALGSASPIVAKTAFGIALPTIIIAGVVNGSVACKYIYVRMWKGTNVIHGGGLKSVGSWVAICAVLWTLSWIIAEAIPSFNLLLGLISALFCSWFSYGLPAILWIYMNKGKRFGTKRKTSLFFLNVGIFFMGAIICGLGLYSSGTALATGAAGQPFSCENNYKPEALSELDMP